MRGRDSMSEAGTGYINLADTTTNIIARNTRQIAQPHLCKVGGEGWQRGEVAAVMVVVVNGSGIDSRRGRFDATARTSHPFEPGTEPLR